MLPFLPACQSRCKREIQQAQLHQDRERRRQLWEWLMGQTPALVCVFWKYRWNQSHLICFKVVLKVNPLTFWTSEVYQASVLTLSRNEKHTFKLLQIFCLFFIGAIKRLTMAAKHLFSTLFCNSCCALTRLLCCWLCNTQDWQDPFSCLNLAVCAVIGALTRFYKCSGLHCR